MILNQDVGLQQRRHSQLMGSCKSTLSALWNTGAGIKGLQTQELKNWNLGREQTIS